MRNSRDPSTCIGSRKYIRALHGEFVENKVVTETLQYTPLGCQHSSLLRYRPLLFAIKRTSHIWLNRTAQIDSMAINTFQIGRSQLPRNVNDDERSFPIWESGRVSVLRNARPMYRNFLIMLQCDFYL